MISKATRKGSMARLLALAGIALMLCSCASTHTLQARGKDLDMAISTRNIPAALDIVENPKLYKSKDRVLYYLDAGMLHHYQGNWQKSNELLQAAEAAIEELQTRSLSRAAASMMLNDNVLEYSGEDYEDVYINVFKALNFLQLGDQDAALVEIRRIDDKLGYLEQKYANIAKEMAKDPQVKMEAKSGSNRFHSSALARYLSLALYADTGNRDEAGIDFDNIRYAFGSQPEIYPFSMPQLKDPRKKSSAPLLRVIAMVNRAPYKKSRQMHIHSSKDLLLIGSVDDEIDVFQVYWPDIDEGYYFKFALPYLEEREPRVARVVAITPDGQNYELHKLEDLGRVATKTYEVKAPLIMFKSISRSVLKGLAAHEAKLQAERKTSSLVALLMSIAADAAIFLSENADLRLSQFFPAEALVAEIPLPEGEHEIRLEYYSASGYLIHSELRSIQVQTRGINILQSWCL